MLEELLIAGAVVEGERGHRARRQVHAAEVSVHEDRGCTPRVRLSDRVAVRIGRSLRRAWWKGNDEVAVHAAGLPRNHKALSRAALARAGAEARIRAEAPVLELLNDGER